MLWTLVVTSVVLAWLTYLLVERPIRFGHSRGRRITALAAAMAGVAGLGSTVWAMGGFDIRFPAEVRPLLAGFLDPARIFHSQWRVNDCFITPTSSNWRFADICAGEGRQPLVLLWGSSAAAALYPGLRSVQEEYGFGLAQYTASRCDPVLGMRDGQPPYCQPINQFVIRKIDELKPDIILMHATWDTYSVTFLDATMGELRKHTAARIILVGREPVWGFDSPDGLPGVYTQYARTHPGSPILPERAQSRIMNEEQIYETATREKAQSLGLEYFSVRDVLCDQTGCLTRVGDLPDGATTFDQFHLSLAASRHVAQPLAQRLFSSSKHLNVSSAAD
jgi:hypothetical protein